MNCPYCGKRTNDIPNHLNKNKMCAKKHHGNLKRQFVTHAQQPLSGSAETASPKSCRSCATGTTSDNASGQPRLAETKKEV